MGLDTATRSFGIGISFKTNQLQPTGEFHGYAATFGNIDRAGDVIVRGAFARTIDDARTHRVKASGDTAAGAYLWPILWQHNEREPIGGIVSASEDSRGLAVVGQLDLDTDLGQRAYSGMRNGYLLGLSIGYDVLRSTYTTVHGKSARQLSEIRLWEVSPVTFPANTEAQVSEVKRLQPAMSFAEMRAHLDRTVASLTAFGSTCERNAQQLAARQALRADPEMWLADKHIEVMQLMARAARGG